MEWQPRTRKRRRDRQRRRWGDDIRSYTGTVWTRTARNGDEFDGNPGQGKGEEVAKEEDGGMT